MNSLVARVEPTNKPSKDMKRYRTKAYIKGLVALPIGEPLDLSLNLGNVFARLVSLNPCLCIIHFKNGMLTISIFTPINHHTTALLSRVERAWMQHSFFLSMICKYWF